MRHCTLIVATLSWTAFASQNGDISIPSPSDWTARKAPSRLIKWTTDPKHAWWKRSPSPSIQSPLPPTPTKCTYVPENTATSCSKGCICDTQCASIFFTNMTKPAPQRSQYHICTNWMLNHPSQLRYGLQEIGFTLLDKPVQCGWQSLNKISALRVGRGSVDVNGTVEQNWGDPLELERVREIMVREYPFVEILVIVATCVGPIFSFLALGFWGAWARGGKKGKVRHS